MKQQFLIWNFDTLHEMGTDSSRPIVAIASIMHESNSFNPDPTTFSDFEFRQRDTVEETLRNWATGDTEVAGMVDESARSGFQIVPILYASATPKGRVEAEAFEELCNRLINGLAAIKRLDGVLLALHGAMYSHAFPHADEEIARRVRKTIGPNVPLIVTHDFHANIPPGIVECTDVLITYQQNPHIDTRSRGVRAASILARMLKGEAKPRQVLVKPPLLWNIAFQNTLQDPLKTITEASIQLEAKPKVLAASVAGGYQYNDAPHMGPSVVVVSDGDIEVAETGSRLLSEMMWERREATRLDLPDAARAVREAMASDRFPVALFDVGDNIGGGSTGDETTILAELLAQKARGWVVVLYDPAAVRLAKSAGVDGAFAMDVGGRCEGVRSRPVRVEGTVRSLHAGRYIETAVRHGGQRYWDMGHTAVVEVAGSTPDELTLLLVTEQRSSPNSLHQLISCGIYPERQKILVAKGTIAPRAAYDPIATRVILVDTPGVTAVNPARFHFERARRDLWGMEN
jgi:microcystin degradation protein MlrC